MKNTFGSSLTITLFGESHGEYIGAVLDGIAPGMVIDRDHIDQKLALRRPKGKISTARVEADEYIFASGVFEGKTTGTPLCVLIPNTNKKSGDYSALADTPRPSHADYTAECKYHGFQDKRGGGHFSGRVTAALVLAGAILGTALEKKGIFIGSHIKRMGEIEDRDFAELCDDIAALSATPFPVLDAKASERMKEYAEAAARDGDSVGGILESAVIGLPAGVGEPWFDTLEGMLSHAIFSVPAVKGIEFGLGFGFASGRGSELNDAFVMKGDRIGTETNNNGGINGGISNGEPIIFRCAIKPTPSIFKEQKTVSLSRKEETVLSLSGRHDPAIIHRARAVIDAVSAIVIADALTSRFGTDYLA